MSSPAVTPTPRGDLPEQLGDYRIRRYLGEGGMGVVYEAMRDSLRSNVALKVMHPQFRGREKYLHRFRTEARSAARLHHAATPTPRTRRNLETRRDPGAADRPLVHLPAVPRNTRREGYRPDRPRREERSRTRTR